jgi:hypothetical protein
MAAGVALAIVGGSSIALLGQAQRPNGQSSAAAGKSAVPRRPDGHPDLSGMWSFSTTTPFERPADLASKEFLTPDEAAAYAKKVVAERNKDKRTGGVSDVGDAYNDFWWDQGTKPIGTLRTSLIIDPKDGRLPPLTADGKKRGQASGLAWAGMPNGPEDRSLAERCLMGFNSGPPMIPSAYNNNVHILQTPDHVALLNEMIHNTRIVPLDGRAHLSEGVRQWAGDPRGHWEGDTLVVETTNFRPDGTGSIAVREVNGLTFRLTERFTRTAPDALIYEFTVNDQTTWTKPWTAQLPMTKTSENIYEYACHEGNQAMLNMLSGARAEDRRKK